MTWERWTDRTDFPICLFTNASRKHPIPELGNHLLYCSGGPNQFDECPQINSLISEFVQLSGSRKVQYEDNNLTRGGFRHHPIDLLCRSRDSRLRGHPGNR